MAAVLDRAFAELPGRLHPVARLGAVVERLDRILSDSRTAGIALAVSVPIGFGGLAAATVLLGGTVLDVWTVFEVGTVSGSLARAGSGLLGRLDGVLVAALAAVVLFSCSSHRLLIAIAGRVVERTETDLSCAREDLRALAGRDATDLSAGEVRSAAVESAAENLADGLIAPLLGFVTGTAIASAAGRPDLVLSVAAGAAAWVKGVNTLDSMVGYPTRRIGWAPARLDDLVMWIPARVSAALVALAAGRPATLFAARRFAAVPESPNSGWPMATAALALDRRLEKPGAYALNPERDLPDAATAAVGVRIVDRAGWLGIALATIAAGVVDLSVVGSVSMQGVLAV
jgi:adenosylcobinamide-phosphate synthase